MDGTHGNDGTSGSTKSDEPRLMVGELVRTSSMRSRGTAAEAIDDPYQEDDTCEEVGLDVPARELRGVDSSPSPEWLWVRVQAEQAAHLSDAGLCQVKPVLRSPVEQAREPSPSNLQTTITCERQLPLFLTVEEAASILRLPNRKAIYTKIERGQVEGVVRQGTKILFERDAFLRGLKRGSK